MRKAIVLVMVVIMMSAWSGRAAAQETVEFSAGVVSFPDDGGLVDELLAGGSARFYLSPRLGVGPEVVFIQGEDHSHLILTGNVTFDFIGPNGGRPPRITPFIVAGAGLYTTREQFSNGTNRSAEGAFTVGGGVRASLGDRVTAGVDARFGWEPHIRVNATLGFRF